MTRPAHLQLAEVEQTEWTPRPAEAHEVLTVAGEKARDGTRGAMATVLARRGSAPSTPGQKLYVAADRTCVGTVGGGAVE
ncbi:MAG TPA: XdhC family protein, partial [Polyangiaceae bacterium]